MNKRFKFRFWDEDRKEFANWLGDWHDTINEFFEWYDGIYVIEQCTGLKDKNGKLIYEGDIVKAFLPDYLNKNFEFIGAIVWDIDRWQIYRPYFGIVFDLYDAYCDKDTGHDKNTIEVIGNIHENKELLRGDEKCN